MALDLKGIYWKNRILPKEWYWFEKMITIESVPLDGCDCVLIVIDYLDAKSASYNPVLHELYEIKEIRTIVCKDMDGMGLGITLMQRSQRP